jgi:uncharacterized protein YecE (DUF72 family)
MSTFIGTAGWSIPRGIADQFPEQGTGLERYASIFRATEINSSFHRPHRQSTWERWRDSVPDAFRFSVKLPKAITHLRKLVNCSDDLDDFVLQASALGEKLAVLLVQLPPKLVFDKAVAEGFFLTLVQRTHAAVACEPRHISWFTQEAEELLLSMGVARVAADPAICDAAALPGGSPGMSYWRLHGSPVIYRSSYRDRLDALARQLRSAATRDRQVWCIFDNTASSAGAGDALALIEALGGP